MKHVELYDFQRIGVRRLRDLNGVALLADEVGLGKTVQSLYYAWKYLPQDPPGPIVCVVPAHLKEVWKRECLKHLGIHSQSLYGERVPKDFPEPFDQNSVIVLNYDILTPDKWAPRTLPPDDSWIVWLAKLKPRLLIGDEGHLLSNYSSQRTRGFRWLSRKCPRTLILSGTPLPNKPENLWSILNILRPQEYDSRWEFLSTYTNPQRMPWGWNFRGARNLDSLHKHLSETVMIRRRKANVLKDLPAVTYSVVPLDCDLKEYRQAEQDVIGWIREQDAAAGERASRAVELARMNTLMQLTAKAKMDAVIKWVRSFLEESDSKLLIGAVHYAVSGAILKALGSKAVLVDGTISEKGKTEGFDAFNKNERIRVLVGNIHAAGTGWSCTSTSDVCFIELPWRPADVTQFAGRVYGIERGIAGTAACVRFLVAPDTIESDLCSAIQRKQLWSAQAIDGDPKTADLDLFSQVRAAIKARGK